MTLPAWVPHEDKPAPQPLLAVQSFVNPLDLDNRPDLLADPDTATEWPRQSGLLGPEGQGGGGAARPGRASDAGGQGQVGAGSGGGLADGLVGLLLIIRDAQHDGTWARLKICGNPDCLWAFYDRSHSRRGAWCDMASCGNLIKNRNLRSRQARRGSGTSDGKREPA